MKIIPLTQGKFAFVDDADFEMVAKFKWYARKDGNTYYAARRNGAKYILMHRLILGASNGEIIDHRDCNGLNNTRKNIWICTKLQNAKNRREKGCLDAEVIVEESELLEAIELSNLEKACRKKRGRDKYFEKIKKAYWARKDAVLIKK